jgi:N-acetylneuraminic acid mutarotase
VSNRLWRYAITEDRWQAAGDLPRPLAGASLVILGEHLYLLGGWDGTAMSRELWRAALPDGENFLGGEMWQRLPPMPAVHAFAGAVGLNYRIYVAGGYDGQRELDTVKVYLVEEERWEVLASLGVPRGGLSLLHDGLAIFAVGGGWTQAVNTIERFDPEANLWSNSPAPIAGEWRNLGAAASIRGYLYLLGGWSDNRLTNHFQYQSSFRSFLPATQSSDSSEVPTE